MAKNPIARVWSRIPVFLKILLYGSSVFALMVGYMVMHVDARQRPCDEARAAEARAWSSLAEHFGRWEQTHPSPPVLLLPDGGLDTDGSVHDFFHAGRAEFCRSAAKQLETASYAMYPGTGPDEDDRLGLSMWRNLEELQARTLSACF